MQRIASFQIDHDLLVPGIYLSRIDLDAIETYDLRFKTPNAGDYLSPAAAHTIEHLAATFLRSGRLRDRVVYFGPMGCLTGFYAIFGSVPRKEVIREVQDCFAFVRDFEGEIPGSRRRECGNYRFHDLPQAKREAEAFCRVIAGWSEEKLAYPAKE